MERNGDDRSRDGQARRARFLAVDFFCGAGGTTRGLIDAGGYVIAGIDKDAGCEATYRDPGNNPNVALDREPPRFLHRDVFARSDRHPGGEQDELMTDLGELIERGRSRAPRTPLLFAVCAPCQPFTKLSRKEMSEARRVKRAQDAGLLKEACRFIERFKPEMVFCENVARIDGPRYGGVWDEFRTDLERMDYATGSKVVCASRFGIPQYRKRTILLGVTRPSVRRTRFADLLDAELFVPDADPGAAVVSVAQAIGHLAPLRAGEEHPETPNHKARALSDINHRRLAAARPGESNAYMAATEHGDLTLDCHRRVNRKLRRRCFTDVYTRMKPDEPSPTITTRCVSVSNGRFGHYDVSQVRAITVREAAVLQSFPEGYRFHTGTRTEAAARMVGNAVPPKLARFFAAYLADSLDPASPRVRRRTRSGAAER